MIASLFFTKRYVWVVVFAWLVTTSSVLAVESDDIPILAPIGSVRSVGQATISDSGVQTSDPLSVGPGIRLIIPTTWADEEQQVVTVGAQEVQQPVATPSQDKNQTYYNKVSSVVHRADPIEVAAKAETQPEVGSTGILLDQPLRTIRLINALSSESSATAPKTPSPFVEEPIQTTPAPQPQAPIEQPKAEQAPVQQPPVEQPKAKQPAPVVPQAEPPVQAEPVPSPPVTQALPRREPAPIEMQPAPIVTPEDIKPLSPSDDLNDDLPYYDYDAGCEAGPCRIPQERIRHRLFRGNTRQMTPQCTTGQCATGDPWGPGHWVGPGIWVPDSPTQTPPAMSGGPVYYDELPCDDGTYGWGPPRRLFEPGFLADRGITLGGWIDQGITYNASDPADRYNGPVTFNDRSGDYQMNQLDVFLEREVDGSESGLDIGGRLDVLFGTDARFTEAVGWETNWDMNERFYRLSIPQMYTDFGWRDWTVRMGHFYSTIGYESVPAVNDFFYSHSYSMQYGEPFTFTGMLAYRKINSQLKVNAGFHRGWDQFNGIYECNRLSVLTGANWISRSGRLKFDFALTAGPQGPDNSTIMYSMVGTYLPRGWLECVVQHDYGQSTGDNPYGIRFAEWYSLNQYVFVTLNERWKVGARIECFCDKQGVRVHGLGQGNLATGPYPGNFWEITLGMNWEPTQNIRIRPEARWDWYDASGPTVNEPFDGGNSDQQFLLGVDAIVQF